MIRTVAHRFLPASATSHDVMIGIGIEIGIDATDLGRREEMIGIERGGVGGESEMVDGGEMREMGSGQVEEMIGIGKGMMTDVAEEERRGIERGGVDGVSLQICWEG
jgi:hypothetical protein